MINQEIFGKKDKLNFHQIASRNYAEIEFTK